MWERGGIVLVLPSLETFRLQAGLPLDRTALTGEEAKKASKAVAAACI